jgi:hypothetical protein
MCKSFCSGIHDLLVAGSIALPGILQLFPHLLSSTTPITAIVQVAPTLWNIVIKEEAL